MLSPEDLSALAITLKLAGFSTVILLLIGTPIAWWLARNETRYKAIIEAIVALPLVLPPTVLGFYLLLAFAPSSPIGTGWFALTGQSLAFSFSGLVVGSVIYSFPFVVQPLQNAFEKIPPQLLESAAMLGASPRDTFYSLVVPTCSRAFMTASILAFAHTVGEFGVVLMIGGNIPGETQVVSIAIYEHVEAIEYTQAHQLAGLLLVSSFLVLLFTYWINFKGKKKSWV
ncbi:MAG: molybdate ABC transporter permease subunit [Pseudomonadales bacterium]|nr:molybdate ABC transporter permease subunit [Pseudomonadales bacterium]